MTPLEYSRHRRQLLEATAWNMWAAQRGYSPAAARRRKENQAALARLRQARRQSVALAA